jgi:hypothetical protein
LPYSKKWENEILLKNGKKVVLRPELPTDTEMLWEMFSTLSKASLDNLVERLTRERIEGWTNNIDYGKNLPILAMVEEEKKARIIGPASLSFYSTEANKTRQSLG